MKTDLGSWIAKGSENAKKDSDLAWAKKFLPVIPESVASLEDAWRAVPEGSDPYGTRTLILIQDAHTNSSCQMNESRLFDLLFESRIADTVFTEAAKGNVNLSFLRDKASLAKRQQIANSYLQKGLLHGIEYLDLTSDHDFKVEGVEEPSLYFESLEVYRKSAKQRESFERYLGKIESTIGVLKTKLLNPFLLDFLEKYLTAQKEETGFSEYLDTLFLQAAVSGISLSPFPALKKLKELKALESAIDFKSANEEQHKAALSLTAEEQRELRDFSASKLSLKDSQRGFFLFLKDKIKDFSSCPNLKRYMNYLEQSQSLDAKEVLLEKKRLEGEIFKSLTTSEDESKLLVSIKVLEFYKKLFHLSLTPEEYQEFCVIPSGAPAESRDLAPDSSTRPNGLGRNDMTDLKVLSGFLNKKLMNLKDHYDKAIFLNEDFSEMSALCQKFYELTYRRDQKFLENIERTLTQLPLAPSFPPQADPPLAENKEGEAAILITGGYHTPNLKYLLKKSGISYICLTPQVTHETNIKRYEEILLSQKMAPVSTPAAPAMTMPGYAIAAARLAGIPGPAETQKLFSDLNSAPVTSGVSDSSFVPQHPGGERERALTDGARLAVPDDEDPKDTLEAHGYVVQGVMGGGLMGITYQVVAPDDRKTYAVKMFKPRLLKLRGMTAYFENELRMGMEAHQRIPSTARILVPRYFKDGSIYGAEAQLLGMRMEFIDGKNLDEACDAREISFKDASDRVLEINQVYQNAGIRLADKNWENYILNRRGQLARVDMFKASLVGAAPSDGSQQGARLSGQNKKSWIVRGLWISSIVMGILTVILIGTWFYADRVFRDFSRKVGGIAFTKEVLKKQLADRTQFSPVRTIFINNALSKVQHPRTSDHDKESALKALALLKARSTLLFFVKTLDHPSEDIAAAAVSNLKDLLEGEVPSEELTLKLWDLLAHGRPRVSHAAADTLLHLLKRPAGVSLDEFLKPFKDSGKDVGAVILDFLLELFDKNQDSEIVREIGKLSEEKNFYTRERATAALAFMLNKPATRPMAAQAALKELKTIAEGPKSAVQTLAKTTVWDWEERMKEKERIKKKQDALGRPGGARLSQSPQRPGMAMEQRMTMTMTLEAKMIPSQLNYRGVTGILGSVLEYAGEHGRGLKRYHKNKLDFEYYTISAEDYDPEKNTALDAELAKKFAQEMEDAGGGFALYEPSRGGFICVVSADKFPMPFREYVAVHEYGESVFRDHEMASKAEFKIAQKEGKLGAYIQFLEANYPVKFANVFVISILHSPTFVPDDLRQDSRYARYLEYQKGTDSAQNLIKLLHGFEWPEKLKAYIYAAHEAHEKYETMLAKVVSETERLINPENCADWPDYLRRVESEMKKALDILARDLEMRRMSRSFINYLWYEQTDGLALHVNQAWKAYIAKLGEETAREQLQSHGLLSHSLLDFGIFRRGEGDIFDYLSRRERELPRYRGQKMTPQQFQQVVIDEPIPSVNAALRAMRHEAAGRRAHGIDYVREHFAELGSSLRPVMKQMISLASDPDANVSDPALRFLSKNLEEAKKVTGFIPAISTALENPSVSSREEIYTLAGDSQMKEFIPLLVRAKSQLVSKETPDPKIIQSCNIALGRLFVLASPEERVNLLRTLAGESPANATLTADDLMAFFMALMAIPIEALTLEEKKAVAGHLQAFLAAQESTHPIGEYKIWALFLKYISHEPILSTLLLSPILDYFIKVRYSPLEYSLEDLYNLISMAKNDIELKKRMVEYLNKVPFRGVTDSQLLLFYGLLGYSGAEAASIFVKCLDEGDEPSVLTALAGIRYSGNHSPEVIEALRKILIGPDAFLKRFQIKTTHGYAHDERAAVLSEIFQLIISLGPNGRSLTDDLTSYFRNYSKKEIYPGGWDSAKKYHELIVLMGRALQAISGDCEAVATYYQEALRKDAWPGDLHKDAVIRLGFSTDEKITRLFADGFFNDFDPTLPRGVKTVKVLVLERYLELISLIPVSLRQEYIPRLQKIAEQDPSNTLRIKAQKILKTWKKKVSHAGARLSDKRPGKLTRRIGRMLFDEVEPAEQEKRFDRLNRILQSYVSANYEEQIWVARQMYDAFSPPEPKKDVSLPAIQDAIFEEALPVELDLTRFIDRLGEWAMRRREVSPIFVDVFMWALVHSDINVRSSAVMALLSLPLETTARAVPLLQRMALDKDQAPLVLYSLIRFFGHAGDISTLRPLLRNHALPRQMTREAIRGLANVPDKAAASEAFKKLAPRVDAQLGIPSEYVSFESMQRNAYQSAWDKSTQMVRDGQVPEFEVNHAAFVVSLTAGQTDITGAKSDFSEELRSAIAQLSGALTHDNPFYQVYGADQAHVTIFEMAHWDIEKYYESLSEAQRQHLMALYRQAAEEVKKVGSFSAMLRNVNLTPGGVVIVEGYVDSPKLQELRSTLSRFVPDHEKWADRLFFHVTLGRPKHALSISEWQQIHGWVEKRRALLLGSFEVRHPVFTAIQDQFATQNHEQANQELISLNNELNLEGARLAADHAATMHQAFRGNHAPSWEDAVRMLEDYAGEIFSHDPPGAFNEFFMEAQNNSRAGDGQSKRQTGHLWAHVYPVLKLIQDGGLNREQAVERLTQELEILRAGFGRNQVRGQPEVINLIFDAVTSPTPYKIFQTTSVKNPGLDQELYRAYCNVQLAGSIASLPGWEAAIRRAGFDPDEFRSQAGRSLAKTREGRPLIEIYIDPVLENGCLVQGQRPVKEVKLLTLDSLRDLPAAQHTLGFKLSAFINPSNRMKLVSYFGESLSVGIDQKDSTHTQVFVSADPHSLRPQTIADLDGRQVYPYPGQYLIYEVARDEADSAIEGIRSGHPPVLFRATEKITDAVLAHPLIPSGHVLVVDSIDATTSEASIQMGFRFLVFDIQSQGYTTTIPAVAGQKTPLIIVLDPRSKTPQKAVDRDSAALVYPNPELVRIYLDPEIKDNRIDNDAALYRSTDTLGDEFWRNPEVQKAKIIVLENKKGFNLHRRLTFSLGEGKIIYATRIPFSEEDNDKGYGIVLQKVSTGKKSAKNNAGEWTPQRIYKMNSVETIYPHRHQMRVHLDPINKDPLGDPGAPLYMALSHVMSPFLNRKEVAASKTIMIDEMHPRRFSHSDSLVFRFYGDYALACPPGIRPRRLRVSIDTATKKPRTAFDLDSGDQVYPTYKPNPDKKRGATDDFGDDNGKKLSDFKTAIDQVDFLSYGADYETFLRGHLTAPDLGALFQSYYEECFSPNFPGREEWNRLHDLTLRYTGDSLSLMWEWLYDALDEAMDATSDTDIPEIFKQHYREALAKSLANGFGVDGRSRKGNRDGARLATESPQIHLLSEIGQRLSKAQATGSVPRDEDYRSLNSIAGAILLKIYNISPDYRSHLEARVAAGRDLFTLNDRAEDLKALNELARLVHEWSLENITEREVDAQTFSRVLFTAYRWHDHMAHMNRSRLAWEYEKELIFIEAASVLSAGDVSIQVDLATALFHNKQFERANELLLPILKNPEAPRNAVALFIYLRVDMERKIFAAMMSPETTFSTAFDLHEKALSLLEEARDQGLRVTRLAGSSGTQIPRIYSGLALAEAMMARLQMEYHRKFATQLKKPHLIKVDALRHAVLGFGYAVSSLSIPGAVPSALTHSARIYFDVMKDLEETLSFLAHQPVLIREIPRLRPLLKQLGQSLQRSGYSLPALESIQRDDAHVRKEITDRAQEVHSNLAVYQLALDKTKEWILASVDGPWTSLEAWREEVCQTALSEIPKEYQDSIGSSLPDLFDLFGLDIQDYFILRRYQETREGENRYIEEVTHAVGKDLTITLGSSPGLAKLQETIQTRFQQGHYRELLGAETLVFRPALHEKSLVNMSERSLESYSRNDIFVFCQSKDPYLMAQIDRLLSAILPWVEVDRPDNARRYQQNADSVRSAMTGFKTQVENIFPNYGRAAAPGIKDVGQRLAELTRAREGQSGYKFAAEYLIGNASSSGMLNREADRIAASIQKEWQRIQSFREKIQQMRVDFGIDGFAVVESRLEALQNRIENDLLDPDAPSYLSRSMLLENESGSGILDAFNEIEQEVSDYFEINRQELEATQRQIKSTEALLAALRSNPLIPAAISMELQDTFNGIYRDRQAAAFSPEFGQKNSPDILERLKGLREQMRILQDFLQTRAEENIVLENLKASFEPHRGSGVDPELDARIIPVIQQISALLAKVDASSSIAAYQECLKKATQEISPLVGAAQRDIRDLRLKKQTVIIGHLQELRQFFERIEHWTFTRAFPDIRSTKHTLLRTCFSVINDQYAAFSAALSGAGLVSAETLHECREIFVREIVSLRNTFIEQIQADNLTKVNPLTDIVFGLAGIVFKRDPKSDLVVKQNRYFGYARSHNIIDMAVPPNLELIQVLETMVDKKLGRPLRTPLDRHRWVYGDREEDTFLPIRHLGAYSNVFSGLILQLIHNQNIPIMEPYAMMRAQFDEELRRTRSGEDLELRLPRYLWLAEDESGVPEGSPEMYEMMESHFSRLMEIIAAESFTPESIERGRHQLTLPGIRESIIQFTASPWTLDIPGQPLFASSTRGIESALKAGETRAGENGARLAEAYQWLDGRASRYLELIPGSPQLSDDVWQKLNSKLRWKLPFYSQVGHPAATDPSFKKLAILSIAIVQAYSTSSVSEAEAREDLREIQEKILPWMRSQGNGWGWTLPEAADWLVLPTIFLLNDPEYEAAIRAVIRIFRGLQLPLHSLGMRAGLNGMHMRKSSSIAFADTMDTAALLPEIFEMILPRIEDLKNREINLSDPEKSELRDLSVNVTNALLVPDQIADNIHLEARSRQQNGEVLHYVLSSMKSINEAKNRQILADSFEIAAPLFLAGDGRTSASEALAPFANFYLFDIGDVNLIALAAYNAEFHEKVSAADLVSGKSNAESFIRAAREANDPAAKSVFQAWLANEHIWKAQSQRPAREAIYRAIFDDLAASLGKNSAARLATAATRNTTPGVEIIAMNATEKPAGAIVRVQDLRGHVIFERTLEIPNDALLSKNELQICVDDIRETIDENLSGKLLTRENISEAITTAGYVFAGDTDHGQGARLANSKTFVPDSGAAGLRKDDPARYKKVRLPKYIGQHRSIRKTAYRDKRTGQLFLAYKWPLKQSAHFDDPKIYAAAVKAGFDNLAEIRVLKNGILLTRIAQTYSRDELLKAHTRVEDMLLYMLLFWDWDHILAKQWNVYKSNGSGKDQRPRYLIYDLAKSFYGLYPGIDEIIDNVESDRENLIKTRAIPEFQSFVDGAYLRNRIKELKISDRQKSFLSQKIDLVLAPAARLAEEKSPAARLAGIQNGARLADEALLQASLEDSLSNLQGAKQVFSRGRMIGHQDKVYFTMRAIDAQSEPSGALVIGDEKSGTLSVIGFRIDPKTKKLYLNIDDQREIGIENYKIILKNRRDGRREAKVILSRKELSQVELKYNLSGQVSAVTDITRPLITKEPKLLTWKLDEFMNERTRQTDDLFADWLVRAMHRVSRQNAVFHLEGSSPENRGKILARAAQLYPGQTFVYDELPAEYVNNKTIKRATVVAVDPDNIPMLSRQELHLIVQAGNFHNLDALAQALLGEAEIGLEGIQDIHNRQLIRDLYQALGANIPAQDIAGFSQFIQGIGLTLQTMRWAIRALDVENALRSYILGARMAEQAA